MTSTPRAERRDLDLPTILAIGLLAYAVANLAHEGLGHGGVCVAVGGRPQEFNAIYFECDKSALGPGAIRWIAAGGSLVNLALAALCAGVARSHQPPLAPSLFPVAVAGREPAPGDGLLALFGARKCG